MDDNRKKPNRGKPPRSVGSSRPAKGGDGGKLFRKSGEQRSFRKDGEEGRTRFERSEGGPRKFDREGGEGEKRFRKFDGPRPPRKDDEEGRTRFERSEGGPRKFDREGGEGEKRFRKFDGPRPPRKEGEEGRKRFERSEGGPRKFDREGGSGEKPFRKFDGAPPPRKDGEEGRKRFERSEGGPRKFDREGGDKPFRKFDGPRKFDKDKPRGDREAPRRFERGPAREQEWSEGERIAKRLARAGISSRRDAESLITDGRVRVNGKLVETPALNVFASDRIEVDGQEIPAIERTRLFLFHKPAGLVTTNRDPEGRKTVFEVLPENLPRLMTVGRLDINTEGLLLLTNDGGLSRVLELPATGWLRRYRVRVHGEVDEARLASLKEGIAVEGVFYGAVEAELERTQGTNAWLSIGLREGKNREVKNILGALGLEVTRLIRVSYGPFQLGDLPEGHVLEIKGRMLREQLGDRLIEESGANFDADIATPFPNRPVRRGFEEERPREPARRSRELNVGEGGLVKGGFRRDRERGREEVLGRLTTKPDRKPFGAKLARSGAPAKRGDRDEKPYEVPTPRKVNVWMAPGAKPQGKRPSERAAERREREEGQETRGRPPFRKEGKRFDKPGGAPRSGPRGGGKPPRKG
ncbi:pseudouridine synthase [Mesorhizobium denitrificans]|uniref:Pseudouridine synthase n=1 Tax=Mesorhizobium denitrificans TaxID=2294114 RepID=A0A371XIK0_9HYPH|nr:pseudouridine synthase [Mesorhizobium denitrificans]RFC69042.1 pseudouridine synthase [Mesorhizobium denitrificans]